MSSSDRGDLAIAWRTGDIARARYKDDTSTAFGPEFTISNPGLGPVADPGVMIGGDRLGDFAVAMVQGTPGAYALTGAVYDRAPGAPFIEETENYKRKTRPLLRWRPGLDLWGPQRFRVYIDGQVAAETTVDAFTPRVPLAAGKHTWQIEAIDARGQTSRSRLRTLRIDSIAPTLSVKVTGKRVANQSLKIVVRAKDTGGAGLDHITVDYGDKSAKSSTASTRHRYKRGTFRLKVVGGRQGGQRGPQGSQAADQEVVILRAGTHRLELGARPLLMGILNATPDSFSEERGEEPLAVRVERGRALIAAGADLLDIGGESARGDRPAVSVEEEIERVCGLIAALAGEALISVDTYKPEVAAAAIEAGAAIVNDVSGLRDPRLAEVCARDRGRARADAHGGGAQGHAARSGDLRGRRGRGAWRSCASGWTSACAAGVDAEQLVLDPGPDFAKTPAQTVAILRRLDAIAALGRPILLAASRKDFVGAITGRVPAERDPGTLAALGYGVEHGACILRVHDVAGARDYFEVRAVLRGERVLGALEGLSPERYPDGVPPHLSLG